MGDISVILEGVDSHQSRASLYSTVHGAGRVMSRNQAIKGKHAWECPQFEDCAAYIMPRDKNEMPKNMKCPTHGLPLVKKQLTPAINFRDVQEHVLHRGVHLSGAGAGETPHQLHGRYPDVRIDLDLFWVQNPTPQPFCERSEGNR